MAKRDPATNPSYGRPAKLYQKRSDAKVRQEYWSGLTFAQQIEALDLRLGKGEGATKQRARIARAIEAAKQPKPKKPGKRKQRTPRRKKQQEPS